MRRMALALVVAGVLGLSASPAAAVPRHLHHLTTPNGKTHSIGGGVSVHAPCTAFLNFHDNVHLGVFLNGNNPHFVAPELIAGDC